MELQNKMWGPQLEGTNSVRLQPVGFPDTLDAGWTQTYHHCHTSRAPMRGAGRLLLKRPFYNLSHLSFVNSPLASRSTPILKQTRNPGCLIAITPPADRWGSRAQLPHDLPRGYAIGTKQHNTCPNSHPLRCIPIPHQLIQLYTIFVTHMYSFTGSHDHQHTITNDL